MQCSNSPETATIKQGSEKSVFLKPNRLGFGGFIGFSIFFYFTEQFGSSLVDLAHQLSFYLDSPVLQII